MANFKLFGFQFASKQARQDNSNTRSVVPFDDETASTITTMAGAISPMVSGIDLSGNIKSENERIMRYREIAQLPEVDRAVDEIVSEMIVFDDESKPVVTLNMDALEIQDEIKELIEDEFAGVLSLMNFNVKGHQTCRRWYIDGRIHYHKMFDEEKPQLGIQEIRYIDPRKIKRVREIDKSLMNQDGTNTMMIPSSAISQYWLYSEQGFDTMKTNDSSGYQRSALPMTNESIAYADSGMMDSQNIQVISFLEKAIRAANNLRMIEDSQIIYRLVRAPERRVFYIDTGNLSKQKAEQYVQEIADKHKTKVIYDVNTGEIKNDKRYLAMTEDFWLPRREGSRGTEIDTLEGGNMAGDTSEVEYFSSKLYDALHVPKNRFSEQPSMFDSGAEIGRDEVRFSRFIGRLRMRFNMLFDDILGSQLILKGIMTADEWDMLKTKVRYVYQSDNFFSEQIETNIFLQRVNTLTLIEPFIGVYFSRDFVYQKVLQMSELEAKEQLDAILKETDVELQLSNRKMQIEVAGMPPQPAIAESVNENSDIDEIFGDLPNPLAEGDHDDAALSRALTDYINSQMKAETKE